MVTFITRRRREFTEAQILICGDGLSACSASLERRAERNVNEIRCTDPRRAHKRVGS